MIHGVETDFTEGVSFLLRQLGHHSHTVFSEQIAVLKLTPPHAGILRAIGADPGRSQRALAEYLSVPPSRLVAYLDELGEAGYVERRRNNDDRRQYALYLTAEGKKLMRKLSGIARRHEDRMIAGLTAEQLDILHEVLGKIAQQQGLEPHVHPGFRAPDDWSEPLRRSRPAQRYRTAPREAAAAAQN